MYAYVTSTSHENGPKAPFMNLANGNSNVHEYEKATGWTGMVGKYHIVLRGYSQAYFCVYMWESKFYKIFSYLVNGPWCMLLSDL